MPDKLHRDRLATILLLSVAAAGAAGCKPHPGAAASGAPQYDEPSRTATPARPQPDLSGRTRFGNASFYAKMFTGRKMADGKRMNPHRDNAASRTLPLGTTARVTNIDTGQSAVVTIQDRGPYVKGRIVDLSPSTAERIGITHENGVAKVKVAPILVPLPNGGTKLGVAAPDAILKRTRVTAP